MSALCGGIETGGTWTVCALGRGHGDLVALEEFPTAAPAETIERILAFFSREGQPAPAAVGIGAFGPVELHPESPSWGKVTSTPKPGWSSTTFAPVVRERLAVPVAFDTDVNAACFGEHVWGAGRGAQTLAYLTVGTGIGAGLVHEGRPWHGLVHPEAGHLRVPRHPDDRFGGCCPVHGDCWEGLASGAALAARWDRDPSELPDEHRAWELEAWYLAAGVLAIVYVASPERFVIGGGVLERAGLLARVRSCLRGLNAGYLDTPLLGEEIDRYLVAPALGDRAGVLGAIALAQRLLD